MRRQVRRLVGDFARTERLAAQRRRARRSWAPRCSTRWSASAPSSRCCKDDSIADILINGPFQVYVERRGELEIDAGPLPRQRPPAAHRQPHRRHRRPADRRVLADGRRPPARRQPRQRRHRADRHRRRGGLDPQVLQEALQPRAAGRRSGAMPACVAEFLLRRGPQPRLDRDLRRHRLGQDHPAQRPLGGDPPQGAADHHRGRRRAAAAAAARGAHGDPAAEHRGQGRDPPARAGQERPAHASRPGDPGRGARRGSLRHAAGHEHRPRRLDGHHPRQHAARRHHPPRADGGHVRHAAVRRSPSAARSPRPSA